MDEILNILEELENIEDFQATTLKDAMTHEAQKLYLFYCLEITEQKLTNTLTKKPIEKMQNLKNVFDMCSKINEVADEAEYLSNLYK